MTLMHSALWALKAFCEIVCIPVLFYVFDDSSMKGLFCFTYVLLVITV